jgi:integrase
VEYIMDLESRGKDTRRAELDLRMLDATIGRLPLSHVHQGALQTWIADQRGERASGTVARAMRTVIAVLNLAARVLRDGNRPWLSQAVPKLRAPDWGSVQPVRLTWEEQDRLIAGLPAHLAMPTLFALATGARQAEIVTLQWNQQRPALDLPALAIWWIPPEVRKGSARRTASQQQGRFVVCNAAARAILSAQAGKHADLVFPGPNGQQMDRVNNRGWRAALERAGLDCRFHDLRHTFGERAADAGIPLDIRRSLLGHEHRDITLHYSSPGLARLSEEAERIRRPAARLSLVAAA